MVFHDRYTCYASSWTGRNPWCRKDHSRQRVGSENRTNLCECWGFGTGWYVIVLWIKRSLFIFKNSLKRFFFSLDLLYEGFDEEYQCPILDEDRVCTIIIDLNGSPSVHQFALATNSCSHSIQGINVCLQNHLWLCTPLPKFITSDLYALICKWTTHYCTIPKRHRITFTDFFIYCSHLVEWPAQLNPSSWIINHLQENTSLPSLFDPLTLAHSILIYFI